MNRASRILGLAAIVGLGWGGWSAQARADLGACNDIFVEANAQCEVVPPSVQCETMCTPVSVRASCAARLSAQCDANCSKLPSVQCTGSCSATCMADCDKVQAGSFDCDASCRADCSGTCSAKCASDKSSTDCQASCEGSCAGSCHASCSATPPQADCKASCMASCNGSCKVDTNLDCQLTCQAKGEASCEVDIEGGCKTQCKKQEGALFCSGAYVDHGDNLQQCIAALKAKYHVQISASASGTSGCDDAGACSASGKAKVSSMCSAGGPGMPRGGGPMAAAALAVLLAALAMRRARG